MVAITEFISHYFHVWNNSPEGFPNMKFTYSPLEQRVRETNFDSFQDKLKNYQSPSALKKLQDENPGTRFFPVFKSFLQTVFDFEEAHLQIILSDEFKEVTKDFYYKARKFGPELSPENIYQAMRNVWIINGLQLIMNKKIEITPSVFAYSLIYPYSDNFLDDPAVTFDEKKEFSERFSHRLHGKIIQPQDFTEEQLFRLVAMIEGQYPRNEFQEVYESLYAIHEGQTKSLQLVKGNLPSETILEISFEKGGASVLADGYLAAGKLTAHQEKVLFGYGVYLQLLDDIQDIKEDNLANTSTIFNDARATEMDSLVCKTIHFGREVLTKMYCFNSPNIVELLDLMNYSIETMIVESIGLNPGFYSEEFLAKFEKHSPLTFDYIRQKRQQSRSQRFAIFKKYFEQEKIPA